jgi:4-amino-4-deoxychorismate lyase
MTTNNSQTILINGKPSDLISVNDRGFMYGDGVFDTMRFTQHGPLLWERHMARLQEGLLRLGLPEADEDILTHEAHNVIQASGREEGALRIVVTTGAGERGYARPQQMTVTRVVSAYPFNRWPGITYNQGAQLVFCRMRLSCNSGLAGIKHMNRLEQVMARTEITNDNISEGIMLDDKGNIISGTMSNIFIIRNKELLTPDLSESGVKGVVRGLLLDRAVEMGFFTGVRKLSMEDLENADECIITNSLIGICPVKNIDQYSFRVGPNGASLMNSFREYEQST